MEKQFVTYAIALALKELGFNEPCLAEVFVDNSISLTRPYKNSEAEGTIILVPLWQQAMDWFREEHNLHITFLLGHDLINIWYDYHIMEIENSFDYTPIFSSENGMSYEEAREQSILKTLEILKQNHNTQMSTLNTKTKQNEIKSKFFNSKFV